MKDDIPQLDEVLGGASWESLTKEVNAPVSEGGYASVAETANTVADHQRPSLQDVLDTLSPIDFKHAAGLGPSEKATKETQVVLISQEVDARAREIGSGFVFMMGWFFFFVGSHWKRLETSSVRAFLGEASQRIGIRMVTAKFFRFLDDLVKQAESSWFVERPTLSRSKHLANFKNCTVEIDHGSVRVLEHSMSNLLTYVLPWDYDPGAPHPAFSRLLDRVVPDEASQLNLAEFIGWLFLSLRLETALFLLGNGSNGKSSFAEIMINVIGRENVTHQSLESLGSDYHRANLGGFLLNHSSEVTRLVRPDIFKKLVSGEPIEARKPYGSAFILHDYAKLMFNCNELPIDVEHTEAFFRRLLIIRFDARITEDERDPDIARKIVDAEAPGIFNWIVKGAQRLLTQGHFTPNPSARATLEEYRLESDSVALYMHESSFAPATDREHKAPLGFLYERYKSFCSENNYRQTSARTFHRRLKALGYASLRSNKGVMVLVREVANDVDFEEPDRF